MTKIRKIQHIGLQILSPPDGDGNIIELLDDKEDAFVNIYADKAGVKRLVFLGSDESLDIPLNELIRNISLAEEELISVCPEDIFDE